jgi:hypothetical protein
MDDWWITTTSDEEGWQQHKEITHKFLDHMEECSYFLKPSKCQFEMESIKILRWIVGGGCVCPDPVKIERGLSSMAMRVKDSQTSATNPWALGIPMCLHLRFCQDCLTTL